MKLRKDSAFRFLRGGSHSHAAGFLRWTFRIRVEPVDRGRLFGFRYVIRGQK